MKFLLIGGPRDGERLEMPTALDMVKLVAERGMPSPPLLTWEAIPESCSLATCIYKRQEWRDGDRRYFVWVHKDEADPLGRLLAGYLALPEPDLVGCPECRGFLDPEGNGHHRDCPLRAGGRP